MIKPENLLLYAVTDRSWTGKKTLLEQIELALEGGITFLQLREKNLDFDEFVSEAKAAKKLCERYGVPLIINDNLEVALESGADGVHVGQEDLAVSEIRKKVGKDFIIGATAKTVSQAIKAESEGADYLGVGAVFPSPTKKTAIRITNEQLREICGSVKIPCVAIGGISLENALEISRSGVDGIAVVSAIFAADDIKLAASELKLRSKEIAAR